MRTVIPQTKVFRSLFLWVQAMTLFIFVVTPVAAYQSRTPQDLPREMLTIQAQNGEQHTFEVQMAKTDDQKRIGLMFRRTMPREEGMFFLYTYPEIVGIWMHNTYIPLDIIFIKGDGTILNISHNAVPLSLDTMYSAGFVNGVLEINGGLAETLGIEPGDKVLHPFFDGDNR